jgi:hypothetical protein
VLREERPAEACLSQYAEQAAARAPALGSNVDIIDLMATATVPTFFVALAVLYM